MNSIYRRMYRNVGSGDGNVVCAAVYQNEIFSIKDGVPVGAPLLNAVNQSIDQGSSIVAVYENGKLYRTKNDETTEIEQLIATITETKDVCSYRNVLLGRIDPNCSDSEKMLAAAWLIFRMPVDNIPLRNYRLNDRSVFCDYKGLRGSFSDF